jgi:hypothetical protein
MAELVYDTANPGRGVGSGLHGGKECSDTQEILIWTLPSVHGFARDMILKARFDCHPLAGSDADSRAYGGTCYRFAILPRPTVSESDFASSRRLLHAEHVRTC